MKLLVILLISLLLKTANANCMQEMLKILTSSPERLTQTNMSLSYSSLQKIKKIRSILTNKGKDKKQANRIISMIARSNPDLNIRILQKNDIVNINDKEFIIQSFLGSGAEALVYKAIGKHDRKTVAIKLFYKHSEVDFNVSLLDKLKKLKVPVINIISVDKKTKAVVQEYIDGISFDKVIEEHQGLLSLKEVKYLKRKFFKFIQSLPEKHQYHILRDNVILDFNSGNFIILDPY